MNSTFWMYGIMNLDLGYYLWYNTSWWHFSSLSYQSNMGLLDQWQGEILLRCLNVESQLLMIYQVYIFFFNDDFTKIYHFCCSFQERAHKYYEGMKPEHFEAMRIYISGHGSTAKKSISKLWKKSYDLRMIEMHRLQLELTSPTQIPNGIEWVLVTGDYWIDQISYCKKYKLTSDLNIIRHLYISYFPFVNCSWKRTFLLINLLGILVLYIVLFLTN